MSERIVDKIRDALANDAERLSDLLPLRRYEHDVAGFALDVCGQHLTIYQLDVIRRAAESKRFAWRSGHKVGKSCTLAVFALWFVCTRPGARVILICPTARQVRGIVWREITRLHRNAHGQIGGTLHETPDRGLQFEDGREVVGFSTDSPERVAGFSGPAMLFLVDEASGITEDLFAAIQGNMAGGGKIVLTGNPTRASGTFFDAFNGKSAFYERAHTSSLDTPNVTGAGPRIDGLAERDWASELRNEWGETSPLYQVRVLGEFPSQAANAIIGIDLVADAVARWSPEAAHGPAFDQLGRLTLGCDPARFGDDESVVFVRRGSVVLAPWIFRQLDGVELASKVIEIAQRSARSGEVPLVRVDVIGVGASVFDQLRRSNLVEVEEVNVSCSATIDTYSRLRDQVWFDLRDFLRAGGAIPRDTRLEAELVAATFDVSPSGKVQVESKSSMKTRLKRSPDRADALALCVMGDGPQLTTAQLWAQSISNRSEVEWMFERYRATGGL